MGSKRTFSEVETPPSEVNRPDNASEHLDQHYSKRRKGNKKHKAREGTVNWAKKRARTIERRFQRGQDLPANVQRDLERELSAHQRRILEEKDKKHRNRMIKKYHMVRFYERQKASRLEKQLRQRLEHATEPEEIASLKADLHIAEVDVHYARYFPFMERYVGLYSQAAADPKADEKARAKIALHSPRPPLWTVVEEAMEKGQNALVRLQNRRPAVDSSAKPAPEQLSKHSFAAKVQGSKKKHSGGENKEKTLPSRRKGVSEVERNRGSAQGGTSGRMKEVKGDEESSEDSESEDGGFFEEG